MVKCKFMLPIALDSANVRLSLRPKMEKKHCTQIASLNTKYQVGGNRSIHLARCSVTTAIRLFVCSTAYSPKIGSAQCLNVNNVAADCSAFCAKMQVVFVSFTSSDLVPI